MLRGPSRDRAAAIAFWAFFSIFPLLMGPLSLVGFFLHSIDIESRLYETVTGLFPAGASLIQNSVETVISGRGTLSVFDTTQGEGRGRHHRTLVAGIVEVRPSEEGSGSRPEPAVRSATAAPRGTRARFHRGPLASPGYSEPQARNVGTVRPGQCATGYGGANRRMDWLR